MNIVLINHYAGSTRHGMEYRPFYMARHWVRWGHRVTVVAASFSHLRQLNPEMSGRVREEVLDGVRYIWLRTPAYRGNGVWRTLNMFSFTASLMRRGREITGGHRPDLVIASSTYLLDVYPAKRLAKRHGAKLVFEVHDLWPLSPMQLGGMSRFHPFILLLQKAEDFACRHADLVVSLLPNADEHLVTRGMLPEKFHHIPNGIETEEWRGIGAAVPESHQKILRGLRAEGKFIVGYIGGHAVSNALDILLDAAARLRGQDVAFVLVGHGVEKQTLLTNAQTMGLKHVTFVDSVPKECVPELLSAMDALYIGWRKLSLYRFGVSPNKLVEYMMSGKPIVHSTDAPNDMVEQSACGISVSAEDGESIAKAISGLAAMRPEDRLAMGSRGRAYVLSRLDYRVLAREFLAAVDR